MDSRKYSLADFSDNPELDIMQLSRQFQSYIDDAYALKQLQYRRVSLTGSGPEMDVIDPYTGQIRTMINMASNDYFNLTKHPRTIDAGIRAIQKYGSGSGSVPLLGGTLDIHIELEKRVSRFKSCEDAIIYSNGFGSNAGTLAAILKKNDIAILDMLVHASIVDGCKGTKVEFFRHNNLASLEKVLRKVKDSYRTKLVVVDGVYSMDGDISPLNEIVEIAHQYGAYVFVDEAHATGVLGKNGRGTPEHYHIEGKVDFVAGTFSKALGVVGGFVAGPKEVINYLHYYSRTYMFSTAMTPQTAASLIEAMNVIEEEPELRRKLWDNIHYFRKNLLEMGFDIGNSQTAIFPIIVGDDYKVREICRELHENNVYVNPVQYPAVPKKLSRVRISLMSSHTTKHLNRVLELLETFGRKYGIVNRKHSKAI